MNRNNDVNSRIVRHWTTKRF